MGDKALQEIWPFFGLQIVTPMVTLNYPTDAMLPALCALAADGIHPVDEMPFVTTWSTLEPAEMARSTVQFNWASRGKFSPDDWQIGFCVFVRGRMVGYQDIFATQFPKRRIATSGSWLGQAHQGQGIGTEMRQAVLHLLFEGLGATAAFTEARDGNMGSIGVTEKLGYEPNGEYVDVMGDGEPARTMRYRLSRERWEAQRRDDIVIRGLEPCLPILGLA